MPLIFSCPCGKRLKAADELAGKLIRCPQCGARRTVPSPTESQPLFEITEGDDPEADEGLSFPWLNASEEPLLGAKPGVTVVAAPRAEVETPIAALFASAPESSPAAREEPPTELEELIQPVLEPLRPSYLRPVAVRDTSFASRGLREPWYVAWVEGLARVLTVAAIASAVLVPAAFLIGGLIALARTGDPKAMFAVRWMGVRVFGALLTAAGIIVATAALWAAPFLLVVDMWRRYRAMSARLDAFLNRAEQLATIRDAPADEADATRQ